MFVKFEQNAAPPLPPILTRMPPFSFLIGLRKIKKVEKMRIIGRNFCLPIFNKKSRCLVIYFFEKNGHEVSAFTKEKPVERCDFDRKFEKMALNNVKNMAEFFFF